MPERTRRDEDDEPGDDERPASEPVARPPDGHLKDDVRDDDGGELDAENRVDSFSRIRTGPSSVANSAMVDAIMNVPTPRTNTDSAPRRPGESLREVFSGLCLERRVRISAHTRARLTTAPNTAIAKAAVKPEIAVPAIRRSPRRSRRVRR